MTDMQPVFAHQRTASQKEVLDLLKTEKAEYAKDVGQNVLKVFFTGSRSLYTKGTVKVRAALSDFV